MKRTTFNVAFYCRRSKASKSGLAPIDLSIIINGRREIIPLPRRERPDEFKAALAAKRQNDIKDYVEATRRRLNVIVAEMMEHGLELEPKSLRKYFQYGGVLHYTIEDLFNEYLDIVAKKAGDLITEKAYRKYELARDKFFKVIDKELPVTAITSATITEFMRVLRLEYNQVTANGYMPSSLHRLAIDHDYPSNRQNYQTQCPQPLVCLPNRSWQSGQTFYNIR